MIRAKTFDPLVWIQTASALLLALVLGFMTVADADAQRRRDNNEADETNRSFTAAIGERAQAILELQDQEQYAQSITLLNQALALELTAYERATLLRMRGLAYYQTENVRRAIDDFVGSINTGALLPEEVNTLRVTVGQLYMVEDNVPEGIRQIELALSNGATLNVDLARLLAQGYAQLENWNGGLRYAEYFYNNKPTKSESEYSLMQYYYRELNRTSDELRVVREQLNAFPGARNAWQNLVSLYARLDREEDAFEANKLMYLNGLFSEGARVVNLAQYYSYYENPYRGASILEREMNAGRVEANIQNLETLSNMWRQAAEFDRAIPVLERISSLRGDGTTALQLAEALYQRSRYQEAARWFETALERGGLRETGQAWVLLGTVRFELDNRQGALAAFEQGARFEASRRSANDWARFVRAQIQGEIDRARRREGVRIDECRLRLEGEIDLITLLGNASDFNEFGQPVVEVPENCTPYFNENGVQLRMPGQTDEQAAEYAAAQIASARAQAEAAMGRAG